ncbi:hypothetical protein Trydic_g23160 [Trypoxylus dichotomus]
MLNLNNLQGTTYPGERGIFEGGDWLRRKESISAHSSNAISAIEIQVRVSRPTAVEWTSFCREVVLISPTHAVERQWVLGGYDPGTSRMFVVPVQDCGVDTLLPILRELIQKQILDLSINLAGELYNTCIIEAELEQLSDTVPFS